jgi:hypothetical protein
MRDARLYRISECISISGTDTNVVFAYNSMLLSGLVSRYLAAGNEKTMDLLRRISPAAGQYLHFLGHFAFRDKRKQIDLEAIPAGIDWQQPSRLGSALTFGQRNPTYAAPYTWPLPAHGARVEYLLTEVAA